MESTTSLSYYNSLRATILPFVGRGKPGLVNCNIARGITCISDKLHIDRVNTVYPNNNCDEMYIHFAYVSFNCFILVVMPVLSMLCCSFTYQLNVTQRALSCVT